jgi:hypothetical protein
MEKEELKIIFLHAAEIAKVVPANLQEAAFNRALDTLLPSSKGGKAPPKRKKHGKAVDHKVKVAGTKRTHSAPKLTTVKSGSARIGPKAALESLLKATFWNQQRTIGELQDHLRTTRGYKYKATELSPALVRLLREGKIDRNQNKENQYEYKPK